MSHIRGSFSLLAWPMRRAAIKSDVFDICQRFFKRRYFVICEWVIWAGPWLR